MSEVKQEGKKFRENGIMVKEWLAGGNVLRFTFLDKSTVDFDKRLVSVSNRSKAEMHGWGQRLGDLGAIEVREIAGAYDRSVEAKRRIKIAVDHYMSSSDDWNLPSGPRQSGPSEEDLIALIERVFQGRGQEILTKTLAKAEGDLPKAKAQILSVKEFAKAWADLQAERRAQQAEKLDVSADDFLASLV